MPVLMGGSGSTGSTLLRTVMNRHPQLFSGEELNFFNKEQLFTHWRDAAARCMRESALFPFATRGWFAWPGHNLTHRDYGWSHSEVEELMSAHDSVRGFATSFFSRPLGTHGANEWLEKTPSNAYSFRHFLGAFPGGKVIHTTRDPLAAVASLVRRGMSPLYASALWIYNTASAYGVDAHERSLLVRYEDLTEDPEGTVQRVFAFLDFPYHRRVLQPQEDDGADHVRNPGWRHSRTEAIVPNVSGFYSLSEATQKAIRIALSELRVSRSHAQEKGLDLVSGRTLARALGYPFEEVQANRSQRLQLRLGLEREGFRRTVRRYPTGFGFFPIELKSSDGES